MPCLVKFANCNKTRCDKGCRTCQYYIPGRGSVAYNCGLPPEDTCPDPEKDCKSCIWHVPDRRFTDEPGTKQERYRKRHPDKERERKKRWRDKNRKKIAKYMRDYREKKWK